MSDDQNPGDANRRTRYAASLHDRFRDPRGWLLDVLPWPIRRLYFAYRLRAWPPDAVRHIGCRRPSRSVMDYFEEIHRRDVAEGRFDA